VKWRSISLRNYVICRWCELAVAAEFITVHVRGKHGICCSDELVESITRKYQPRGLEEITQFRNACQELDVPASEIPLMRAIVV